jgi:biopolymer transport protein ExbD
MSAKTTGPFRAGRPREYYMASKLGARPKGNFSLGQNSDINVTPFVDVMLVLLIIFMVAAPMATVSIKIDLPPASSTPSNGPPPTFVSIADGGQVYVSFGPSTIQPSTLANLGADVARALNVPNPHEERVFIRADAHVKYNEFMEVINTLQRAGYSKIGLINEDLQDDT